MAAQVSLQEAIRAFPTSSLELAALAEEGIPTDCLSFLKENGFTFTELAETVISPRTLKHRKARGEKLSREETQRVLRVASVVALAGRVFGDHDLAMRWLRTANGRLTDRTPLSFLSTEPGGRLIESMLWGIDEGIYS